jgi:hypothetical protein
LEMEEGDTIEVYQPQTGGRGPYFTCWSKNLNSKQFYSALVLSHRTCYNTDSSVGFHSLLVLEVRTQIQMNAILMNNWTCVGCGNWFVILLFFLVCQFSYHAVWSIM